MCVFFYAIFKPMLLLSRCVMCTWQTNSIESHLDLTVFVKVAYGFADLTVRQDQQSGLLTFYHTKDTVVQLVAQRVS